MVLGFLLFFHWNTNSLQLLRNPAHKTENWIKKIVHIFGPGKYHWNGIQFSCHSFGLDRKPNFFNLRVFDHWNTNFFPFPDKCTNQTLSCRTLQVQIRFVLVWAPVILRIAFKYFVRVTSLKIEVMGLLQCLCKMGGGGGRYDWMFKDSRSFWTDNIQTWPKIGIRCRKTGGKQAKLESNLLVFAFTVVSRLLQDWSLYWRLKPTTWPLKVLLLLF